MNPRVTAIVCVVLMVILIVGVDVAFLRHRFWERLIVNVVIVVVFAVVYAALVKRP